MLLSIGNELTPSAKYDFKFKDYAPWVFRELREDYFQIDPADYLLSLTAKCILSELGSPGKSGSFFYFSRDYRFIIKTIRHSEHKFLLSVLKDYHAHVKNNPHTLLSRFYGLHRVKLPRGRKIHFVIMNNLFPPHKDIHETFDLKGSTVGREYPEEKAKQNPRAVLKDLNWIKHHTMLELGPEKRAFLTEQLRRDSEFLSKIHVMDYSLLVGIHHMQRGNKENVRSNTLKVFSVGSCIFWMLTAPLTCCVASHLFLPFVGGAPTSKVVDPLKPSLCFERCVRPILRSLDLKPSIYQRKTLGIDSILYSIKTRAGYKRRTRLTNRWIRCIIWGSSTF